jgi:flagellar hook-associated protein 1 FlgK
MSNLFGSMSIALQSLLTQQGTLGVVANNIANANTPGYFREIPNMEETPPVIRGNVLVGTGVTMAHVQSVRDDVLNLCIQQETQQQSGLNSYLESMNQVQAVFNEIQGGGLQSVLTSFFNSFQSLAADPTNSFLRQGVITAGQNLANVFKQTRQKLATIQQGLDKSVVQTVTQVNQLSSQIANLNKQIQAVSSSGQDAGPLLNQRDQPLQNLSHLVDTAVICAGDGTVSVTTTKGALLVEGNQSQPLTVQIDSSGMHDVFSQGTDITAAITGGELRGHLNARDGEIPTTQSALNNLAASLTSAVNAQQRAGFDLSGVKGQDFFVPFAPPAPGSNACAALAMAVAVTNRDQVAASSDGTAGSGGNARALAGLQNQPIVSGQTIADYYSNLVLQLSNTVSNASAEQDAVKIVLQQLKNQQSAISGVSLDEEATNLILYQRAYEATARVMSVVDGLTSTTIPMFTPS